MTRTAELRRARQHLVVEPTDEHIKRLLEPQLSYVRRQALYGPERMAKAQAMDDGTADYAGPAHMDLIPEELFDYDNKKRFHCCFGFYDRISRALTKAGYSVTFRDLRPHPNPEVYEPRWDKVFEFADLRYMQQDVLESFCSHPCGRIQCPPGYGKSFLIALATRLFPKAKIHVVTKRGAIVRQIYNDLCGLIPDVGVIHGTEKRPGCRVMVYSAASLHHSDFDADFLFADEVHELATDSFIPWLIKYGRSRNFGFSATNDIRPDAMDIRTEAIFGPIILEVTYPEAQEHGMVVPIEIHWTLVRMNHNPVQGLKSPLERMRYGIWRNKVRNRFIAQDARFYPRDAQLLISVDKVEHAVRLKRLLPEFTLVYAEQSMEKIYNHPNNTRNLTCREWYTMKGLIPEDEPIMSEKRREGLRREFERGDLRKVIATSVWSTGVNFRQLPLLIRADGLASPIPDTQIPGRTSRLFDGKEFSIVRDYDDVWDRGFKTRTSSRKRNYKKHGWRQIYPDRRAPASTQE